MIKSHPSLRLAALGLSVLVLSLLSCGREPTGPASSAAPPVSVFRRAGALAVSPRYETALPSSALQAALSQVAFERVHIVLHNADGTVALDTMVNFPAGADSLTLTLLVPLPSSTPASGAPLSLNISYVNAAGVVVFQGGPFPVTIVPSTGSGSPPPVVQVPVHYTGPGAGATRVVIAPKTFSGLAGQGTTFTAQAQSSDGTVIAGTPIVYASSDASVVRIDANTGSATLVGRGSARVYAQLLTGPTDSASVTVVLPAARLALVSGDAQSGPAGATLAQPVMARVTASDGVGVGGVTVTFAASGGGSVTPATAVSAADGAVSTQWKLGTTAGPQALTMTATGLSGSPITVNAIAQAVVASKLAIVTGPVSGQAAVSLPVMTVAAQDANGNAVTTFTGDVTVAIGTNPGGATLSGIATAKAVAGIATFSDIKLNRPGTGYTLTFTSLGLSGIGSAAFNIAAGSAARLVFGAMPAAVDAGISIAPALTVSAQDSAGNAVSSFTGAVTVAIGSNPGTATLSGTLSRSAVAGVATFADLKLNKKGVAYTLTAAATGMVSATSAAFSVTPGPASGLSVVSGGGQSAQTYTALAPIVVRLKDAFGNGIQGVTLTFAVVSGGGSLGATTAVTDINGQATVAWTLGGVTGTQGISVAAAGVPTLNITATALAGTAMILTITTGPSTTQTAGLAVVPSMVVQARDSLGAPQPTFAGTVTASIASGPAGATISGTASVAAVTGVATFSALRLPKAGAYTLTFAAGGLTSVTTSSFSVLAAPAKIIAADSGTAQSANAGSPLPAALVVLVTDSVGNPVSGASVTWAVASGGGSLDSTVTVTNAAGRTRAKLTLGGPGANSATATAAGLTGSPVTFTATGSAVAYSKLWKGTTNTDWNTAGNWQPTGVPVAGDSVQIDSVTNMPVLAAVTTVAKLITASGSTLGLGIFDLTVNGSVTEGLGSVISGTGKLVLGGASGSIIGPSVPSVKVMGTYTLGGSTGFNSDVEVNAGSLNSNGHTANISGNLIVSGTGSIAMVTALDVFSVTGSATFGGGNVALANGELRLGGSFTQTSGTFTHAVGFTQFIGAAAKTVSFSDVTATSYFREVRNNGSGAITLSTPMRVMGNVASFAGAGNWLGTGKAMRARSLQLNASTQFAVDTLDLWQAGTDSVPVSLTTTLVVTGNVVALANSFALTGNMIIAGNGRFSTNAKVANIIGTFTTTGSGTLVQNTASFEYLRVSGDITFGGGDQTGLLTQGSIRAGSNFTQLNSGTGGGNAFRALAAHTVAFDSVLVAGTPHIISFANPDTVLATACTAGTSCFGSVLFMNLYSHAGSKFTTSAKALGHFDLTGAGVDSIATPASSLIIVVGAYDSGCCTPRHFNRLAIDSAATGGISGVTVDTLIYWGTNQTFDPSGNAIGASNVRISGTASTPSGHLAFSGSVSVDGAAAVLDIGAPTGYLQTTGDFRTLNGGKLKMTNALDSVNVGGLASFTGGATTGLLTAGSFVAQGGFTMTGSAFDASGTHVTTIYSTGAVSLQADPASTAIGFQDLAFHGGGAKDVLMTGSTAINVKGRLIARSTSGLVGSSSGLSQVWMKSGGAVYDSTATGDAFRFARLTVSGVTALPKKLAVGDLSIENAVQQLFDSLQTVGSVTVRGAIGQLDLNGNKLRLSGSNKPFLTEIGGTLKMTSVSDSLIAENGNGLYFVGGSTAGLLSNGKIIASGNFQSGGAGANPQSFSATQNHQVRFEGSGVRRLRMFNGGFAASHFGTLFNGTADTLYAKTDIYAALVAGGLSATHAVRTDTSFVPRLYAMGGGVSDVVFDGVSWELSDGLPVTTLNNASFINQDPAGTQFTIKRSGTAGSGSIPALSGAWVFATTPTTGKYLDAQDTDGGSPDALYVNFSGTVSPSSHGGKASFSGTASSNWNTAGAYASVGVGGSWNNAASWSPAGVPGMFDDVTIGLSTSIVVTAGAMVHNLSLSGGILNVGNNALMVRGDVAAGASTINILTGGTLALTGGGARTLDAVSLRNIYVDTNTVVALQSNLQVVGNAVIAGRLVVNGHTLTVSDGASPPAGQLIVQPGGGLKMTQALDSVFVAHALFGGVASDTLLTAGYLSIANNFTQSGDPKSFAPTGTHITALTADGYDNSAVRAAVETAVPGGRRRSIIVNTLTFANPGYSSSRFNILQIKQNRDISFGTNVYALRGEAQNATNSHYLSGSGYKLFIKDGALVKLNFNGTGLQVDSANTATQLDSLNFTTAPVTADQLTLNAIGGAALTLNGLAFGTAPTTGHYLAVNGAATATMVNPKPGAHGGFVVKTGGAAINGWVASRNMTSAAGGAWNTPGTWSPVGIPSRHDTVTINTGASVTLDAHGALNDMVMAQGSTLTIPSFTTLDVYGNWTGDTTSTVTGLAISSYTNFWGDAQVQGRLWGASVAKSMTLVGRTIFDGYVSAGDLIYTPITFDVNGQVASMNAGFSTYYGGRLKMTNAAGDLSIRGGSSFTGGSTDGLLTDGTLRIDSTFYASGAAFAATGNHTTIVSSMGAASNSIKFDVPGATNTTGHFGILHFADATHNTFLKSDMWAVTKLTSAVTGPSINIYRDGAYPAATAAFLHVADVNSTGKLNFIRVALDVYDAKNTSALSNAWFQSFTPTVGETQLTISSLSATPVTMAISALNFWTASANTWLYLHANALGGGALTLNLSSMVQAYSAMSSHVTTTGTPTPVINWTP